MKSLTWLLQLFDHTEFSHEGDWRYDRKVLIVHNVVFWAIVFIARLFTG